MVHKLSDGLVFQCNWRRFHFSAVSENGKTKNFKSEDDLAAAPLLLARLQKERETDLRTCGEIQAKVTERTSVAVSYFDLLSTSLRNVALQIENVRESNSPSLDGKQSRDVSSGTSVSSSVKQRSNTKRVLGATILRKSERDSERNDIAEGVLKCRDTDRGPDSFLKSRLVLVGELEALANEVAGVDRVRVYAETVLKLERLVGDLEAAVAQISGLGRASAQVGGVNLTKLTRAVRIFQTTEAAVTGIAHKQWSRLVSAVDARVDRVAAILRPSVIAEHRVVLNAIGWPPPLSTASGGQSRLSNPLLEMNEDQERSYSESFMALAILQAVQQRRKERQLSQFSIVTRKSITSLPREPFWPIEELVSPVASRAEYHLVQWTKKPELVCALAYRMAQEYVDVIDEFLQPFIDKAGLIGYSAREEWVFSFVRMVSLYFQTHVIPGLANDVREEGEAGSVSAALWLHTVDQVLAFDIRMKNLAVQPLGLFSGESKDDNREQEQENYLGPVCLCISAFSERIDWLALWAKVELEEVMEKLKLDLQKEDSWVIRGRANGLYGNREEVFDDVLRQTFANAGQFKAPPGAEVVLSCMSAITERCRSLPECDQQLLFVREAVAPIAHEYLREVLRRCQELEATTALAEEGAMVKVASCVNSARYCEQSLQDWGEDIFYLTLLQTQNDLDDETSSGLEGSVFEEEITLFKQFRLEWTKKLVSSIARGFEARCQEYLRNKKHWMEIRTGNRDVDLEVSATLVDALAVLQSQLRSLRRTFDDVNFLELWRSVAGALDRFLLNSLVLGGAKFTEQGGLQFAADMQALFSVFKPYCIRPSSFFKGAQEAVILLTITSEEALSILQSETSLVTNQHGVKRTPASVVKKILTQRTFL